MENTLRLSDTLVPVLSQHRQWLDVRHMKTLAWMMIGLISLTQWVPFVHGRAVYAQSSVRRFARWLDNARIDVHKLYGPLIQQALGSWGRHTLYLALDTSLLWEQYCVMRISVIYRGRAIPLVWQVIFRFDIEENFLDDKANGFQLESSAIRSAALTRLALVLALTTLYLVAQGTEVVKQGKRRWVDAHGFRGNSYLKIGWHWVRSALSKGWTLLTMLRLNGEPDPDPARASNNQYVRDPGPTFKVKFVNYAKS